MFVRVFVLFLYSVSVFGSKTVGTSKENGRLLNSLTDDSGFNYFGLGNMFDVIYPVGSLSKCRRAMDSTVSRYRQLLEDAEILIAQLQSQLQQAQDGQNQAVADISNRLAAANLQIRTLTNQLNQAAATNTLLSNQLAACTTRFDRLTRCITRISTSEGKTMLINNQLYELFYYADNPKPDYAKVTSTCNSITGGASLITPTNPNLSAIVTSLRLAFPLLINSNEMALNGPNGCSFVTLGALGSPTDCPNGNAKRFDTFVCYIADNSCTFTT